jgi:hypothetical protein
MGPHIISERCPLKEQSQHQLLKRDVNTFCCISVRQNKISNPHIGDRSQISKVYSTNLQKYSPTTPWSRTNLATVRVAQLVE